MRKKRLAILFSALLAVAIPAGVYAAKTLIKPTAVAGGYYSDIVNRVEISADNTAFTFRKTEAGTQTFQAAVTLSLKKCEADFFARLDDLNVSGMDYDTLIFLCKTPGLENAVPQDLYLPAENEESIPLTYEILLTFSSDAAGKYDPVLEIEFTSGLTEATADERLLQIPLTITVQS
ncbi:MAG: hypothetical protein IJT27_05790 [Clostridia bacterium]|nr:hypothetical protein [Clostridia bacterium]